MSQGFERWLGMMETGSHDGLWDLLDPDCVFWSPVVHTPQQGRPVSHAYLSAAGAVFNSGFRYTRQVVDGEHGVFEFECEIDGIHINGIDMITMRDGRIVEFKVMVRPLKAINMVHQKMSWNASVRPSLGLPLRASRLSTSSARLPTNRVERAGM